MALYSWTEGVLCMRDRPSQAV